MLTRENFQGTNVNPRFMCEEDIRAYTSLGKNKVREIGKLIGARKKIGSRVLYDRIKFDEYISNLEE